MRRIPPAVFVGVGVILALFAVWNFVISPKKDEASALAALTEKEESAIENSKAMLASSEAARAQFRTNYATLTGLGKAVPVDDDIRSLMVQLDAAAGKAQVDFRKISVGSESGASAAPAPPAPAAGGGQAGTAKPSSLPPGATAAGEFNVMPLSFSFRGSYFNLATFLSRVEEFVTVSQQKIFVDGRLLVIESFKLETDQTGFPNIRATIGASSYLIPKTENLFGTESTPSAPAPSAPPSGSTSPTSSAVIVGAKK